MLGVATVDVVNVNREGDIVFGRMPYHCKTPVNSVCNGFIGDPTDVREMLALPSLTRSSGL